VSFPNPDDYDNWQEYSRALVTALSDGGTLASIITSDSYSAGTLTSGGVGAPPAGYSAVWLNESDTNLFLTADGLTPPASALFQVDTINLADGGVLEAKIGDAQIVTAKIADLAVNTAKIANLAVSSAKIANLAVGTAQIDSLAVTAAKIGSLAVETGKIADLAVTTGKINDLAVTTAKIANLAVGSAQINDLAVIEAKIAAAAISTAKIADLAVTTAKIAALAVGTAQIDALAVTAAKIDALAVTSAKINDLAVTNIKIGDYVINAQKLEQYAVSEYDLLEATGTYGVTGSFAQVTLSAVPMEVSITTPNITGDMMILIIANVYIGSSNTGQWVDARFTVGGSSISYFPSIVELGAVDHAMVVVDTIASPTANTTYTIELEARGTADVDIFNATLLALVFKR